MMAFESMHHNAECAADSTNRALNVRKEANSWTPRRRNSLSCCGASSTIYADGHAVRFDEYRNRFGLLAGRVEELAQLVLAERQGHWVAVGVEFKVLGRDAVEAEVGRAALGYFVANGRDRRGRPRLVAAALRQ